MPRDTIFALASAPGRAGIAVIRISGPGTKDALLALGCSAAKPRMAVRATFLNPATQDVLDHGLLLWFPAPHSFTGEDVAELHIHGGRAVIESLLTVLSEIEGTRDAEPGEFTRRAFEHEKMDLTQAEGLADLVDAETLAQQKQALRQMGGALKEIYDDWRLKLIQALAHLEAVIDFPDEDLSPDIADKVWDEAKTLQNSIENHLDDGGCGERIRDGVSVAIVGPPNAGKSSLLNLLARRDAAIVSATPGTTRDVIEVHMDLGGFAVTLIDTAGLRDAEDDIESEGIRRARERAETADLKIAIFDGAAYPEKDPHTLDLTDTNTLSVVNKLDLIKAESLENSGRNNVEYVSVKTGQGVEKFLSRLLSMVREKAETGGSVPLTRVRHRRALEECVQGLQRARAANLPELAAEDLRIAARALGRITGHVDVEELLDVVFRDFCIGK